MLQDLGDGTKVSSLLRRKSLVNRELNDVKGVGSNKSRIHEAIVDQVTDSL